MDADVVIGIFFFSGIAAFTIYALLSRKRRSQAVHEWAAAHGWSYAKSDDAILRQWTSLPIRQGFTRDVLRRTTAQGEIFSLEQYYGSQTGSGTTQHLIGINLEMVVPTAQIVPVKWTHRGYKRFIRVPVADPVFSRDWTIVAPTEADADQIRKLITAGFTTRLSHGGADLFRTGFTLEWHHLVVAMYGIQQVERIEEILSLICDLAREIQTGNRRR